MAYVLIILKMKDAFEVHHADLRCPEVNKYKGQKQQTACLQEFNLIHYKMLKNQSI